VERPTCVYRIASMDMDIYMDIHVKSVDMDVKFHGNPGYYIAYPNLDLSELIIRFL